VGEKVKGRRRQDGWGDQMKLISVICAGSLGQSIYGGLEPSRNMVGRTGSSGYISKRNLFLCIDSLESIPRLHQSLKIPSLVVRTSVKGGRVFAVFLHVICRTMDIYLFNCIYCIIFNVYLHDSVCKPSDRGARTLKVQFRSFTGKAF
jgi:hypothetical protein